MAGVLGPGGNDTAWRANWPSLRAPEVAAHGTTGRTALRDSAALGGPHRLSPRPLADLDAVRSTAARPVAILSRLRFNSRALGILLLHEGTPGRVSLRERNARPPAPARPRGRGSSVHPVSG